MNIHDGRKCREPEVLGPVYNQEEKKKKDLDVDRM